MDNYFTSIGLFLSLFDRGIYATGTIGSNRVGIPSIYKNTRAFARERQGKLAWRMHVSRKIACVIWKNKKPVILLSTHALSQVTPGLPEVTVPRRNGAVRENITTSPIHLEYTTHIRGVDVADQLRASYAIQDRTHKWWHRIFFFLLDMTFINMYVIYVEKCKSYSPPKDPLTHLQFMEEMC